MNKENVPPPLCALVLGIPQFCLGDRGPFWGVILVDPPNTRDLRGPTEQRGALYLKWWFVDQKKTFRWMMKKSKTNTSLRDGG